MNKPKATLDMMLINGEINEEKYGNIIRIISLNSHKFGSHNPEIKDILDNKLINGEITEEEYNAKIEVISSNAGSFSDRESAAENIENKSKDPASFLKKYSWVASFAIAFGLLMINSYASNVAVEKCRRAGGSIAYCQENAVSGTMVFIVMGLAAIFFIGGVIELSLSKARRTH